MATEMPNTSGNENVIFMPGVFNETLYMLMTTHDYFQENGLQDQSEMNEKQRSLYCCEMSRITMRLSCIMAWLMVRKAVYSGKLKNEVAQSKYRLDCRDACLKQNIEAESFLPPVMRELLERSLELYQRVCRLDDDLVNNPYQNLAI